MGRPKEHDEQTRAELLAAAERLIEERGVDALSVRVLADEVGTTTRAIYSLFGSKDGVLVGIAMQAFTYLTEGLEGWPETRDAAADLVDLGAVMYRTFVREHPAVFRLAFHRIAPGLPLGAEFFEARAACWAILEGKVQRVADGGALGSRTVTEAAVEFNALCEGLANAELRGGTMAPGDRDDAVWRDAFAVLVAGFATPKRPSRRSRKAAT
jgi:AcrR family transcriptional regulator